jgi:predicted enzyme related to lactoylglutathione lyase
MAFPMTPPPLHLTTVTVTSPRPLELARFYARLLGWTVTAEEPPGWAEVRSPSGAAPKLDFELDPEPVRPGQAVTVNLQADDLDAAVEWAVSQGAVLAGVVEEQDDLRVLLDPDGHPFGLFR